MEQPLSMTNGSFTFNVPRQIEEREKQAASHTKKASYGKPSKTHQFYWRSGGHQSTPLTIISAAAGANRYRSPPYS
jgi:hypothetical protein